MILDRCPAPVPRTKAGAVEAFRRDTIIAAAICVIARRGVEATRVQDVAVEAAVSKGTIYLYFEGREDLCDAARKQTAARLLAELGRIAAAEATLQDVLTKVVSRALERLDGRDDAILAALAFSRAPHSPFDDWYPRVAKLLPPCDPVTSVPLILDCLRGVLERRLREASPRSRDEVASSTVSMLLHGLAGCPRDSGETAGNHRRLADHGDRMVDRERGGRRSLR